MRFWIRILFFEKKKKNRGLFKKYLNKGCFYYFSRNGFIADFYVNPCSECGVFPGNISHTNSFV